MPRPLLVGAVVYDPKVVVIWEIIGDFMKSQGCDMDTVFYTNYGLLADAIATGQVDVAWNSPLAWLDSQRKTNGKCRAIAMRDTDRDRQTRIVVREESGVTSIEGLRGKTVAFGAKDSPQATLIPMGLLHRHGMEPNRDYTPRRFDVLVGKHGDHVGGERDALNCLISGEADASCVLDLNWQLWSGDGTADPAKIKVLATTEKFDHCVFTVGDSFKPDTEKQFLESLFRMSYDDPAHKEMMDMEGLKRWEPGRTSGFGPLTEAVEAFGFWSS